MRNIYRVFLDLMPGRPLQVGIITAIDGDIATVELPGGGLLTARGSGVIGDPVFVRDGVIEGEAPALPIEIIEV